MKEVEGLLKPLQTTFKGWSGWPYVLVALAILAAIVLLVRPWWQKRKAAKAGGGPASADKPPRLDLRRIWRTFLRRTPREYRRAVPLFRPFVVLGEAGSGKSALIDRLTDWRGQAAQFHPSYVEDPLVQIYQGSHALAQEISAVLLEDPSPRVREALLELWRPLKQARDPEAVVVLDAARLISVAPDHLVRLAQSMRGKLNLLSSTLGRPVDVTLALTHLDRFPGFLELQALLAEKGRTLEIPAERITERADIERCLDEFEDALPLVLTSRPAPEYLEVLRFFREAREWLGRLGIFVATLELPDPLFPEPRLRRIGLTSAKEAPGGFDPFVASITAEDARRFRPERKHQIAAAALAGASLLWMVSGYAHERVVAGEAHRRLELYLEAPADPVQSGFFDYLAAHRGTLARALLPDFADDHPFFLERRIHDEFLEGVRKRLLERRLARYEKARDGVKGLYLLSVYYASGSSPLAKFVLDRSTTFQDALEIPGVVLQTYVSQNAPVNSVPRLMDTRAFAARFDVQLAAELPATVGLLDAVDRATREPVLSRDALAALKAAIKPVQDELDAVTHTRNLLELAALLEKETGLDVGEEWKRKVASAPDIDRAAAQAALALVGGTDLAYPDPGALDLQGVVAAVEQILVPRTTQAPADQKVKIGPRELVVSPGEWDKLITRSRAALLLREFVDRKRGDFRHALFTNPGAYRGVSLDGAEATSFVVGRARVEGLYTAEAIEDKLKPPLVKLPSLLQALPVPEADKQLFAEFVINKLEEYRDVYVAEWKGYWDSFKPVAKTPAALKFALAQLQLPTSPLRRLLKDVSKHTALTLPEDNPFFEPLGTIPSTFAFLRSLAPQPGGDMPALKEYFDIVGRLQATLEGAAPAPAGGAGGKGPKGEADEEEAAPSGLREELSPLGAIALAIYREEEDAFSTQIERWLMGLNVETRWWEPFTGVVDRAYALGQKEVERGVVEGWSDLYSTYVVPLQRSYPFQADSQATANPNVVDAALKPGDAFWAGFESDVGPVLQRTRAGWEPRKSRRAPIAVPAEVLPTVRRLARLRDLLYDREGKPRPLMVLVRPMPLPTARQGQYFALASFLQVGAASIFGFNQRPDWIALRLEWWKADVAAAGAVLSPDGLAKKLYRSVTVPEAQWSFHTLLQRGTRNGQTWEWPVAAPDGETFKVAFQISGDPWEILKAP